MLSWYNCFPSSWNQHEVLKRIFTLPYPYHSPTTFPLINNKTWRLSTPLLLRPDTSLSSLFFVDQQEDIDWGCTENFETCSQYCTPFTASRNNTRNLALQQVDIVTTLPLLLLLLSLSLWLTLNGRFGFSDVTHRSAPHMSTPFQPTYQ